MSLNQQERYFDGQQVIVEDLAFDQASRIDQDRYRVSDFWVDGIVRDPNGLSNMLVTVDGTTTSLINVGTGVAYSHGYRIAIDTNTPYTANNPSFTTNGTCTPRSSGNRGIPLANYALNQPNYIWAEYLQTVGTGRTGVSASDGSIHYPEEYDGYRIAVSTTNNASNQNGLTNAVYLATVFGQGAGNPLISSANGLTDLQRQYAMIRQSAAVRGSSANFGGVEREVVQGTISTPDIRDSAILTHLISNQAITNSKLADRTIQSNKVGLQQIRGSTANSSGNAQEISQGTISTPDIRANAVIQALTDAGSQANDPGTTAKSVTITTVGGSVLLLGSILYTQLSGSAGTLEIAIQRDSSIIPGSYYAQYYTYPGGTINHSISTVVLDSPAAGTYTYNLRSDASHANSVLVAIELRR